LSLEEFKKHFLGNLNQSEINETMMQDCREQYNNIVAKKEDDNYFEPLDESHRSQLKILNQYDEYLNQVFRHSEIEENEIAILIRPSFEAESFIRIYKNNDDYSIICLVPESSIWLYLIQKSDKEELDFKKYQFNIDNGLGNGLFMLFDKTLSEARLPKSKFATLDGVEYLLLKNIESKIYSVRKNLTNENSKTGKITSLIDELLEAIKTQSIISQSSYFQNKIKTII
jgi:hypothetical protein